MGIPEENLQRWKTYQKVQKTHTRAKKLTEKMDKPWKIYEGKPEKLTKSGKTYNTMEKLTEKIDKRRKIYKRKAKKLQKVEKLTTLWKNLQKK